MKIALQRGLTRSKYGVDEFLEMRVGAKRAKTWIQADPDHPVRALLDGFSDPEKGMFAIAEAAVDQRLSVRRHEPRFAGILQPFQILLRQVPLPAGSGRVAVAGDE